MKNERKYILFLVAAFLLYVIIKLFSPAKIDWTVTYHKEDKNPFGGYALNQILPSVFPGQKINQSYQTVYEFLDSLMGPVNFISLSTSFSPGDDDTRVLLKNIENGGSAFIAAHYFYGKALRDSLSLDTENYFFKNVKGYGYISQNDTAQIKFNNPHVNKSQYPFPRKNTNIYFSSFDSTRTTVIASNDLNLPVLIRVQWGKGYLILCSIPLAFTNIYLLRDNHHEFAEAALSFLPLQPVYWTEFYHSGRKESYSELRFILKNESLRWAYTLTILSILVFMIFEAKRKQRIIPVVKPLTNTTLEFVQTIGNLYYQNADHKNIAAKKIGFLMDQIRSKFWLRTTQLDDSFYYALAKKSGNSVEDVQALFTLINSIHAKPRISAEALIELNAKIEKMRLV